MTSPTIENTYNELWPPIPYVENGQIIWNVGTIEVTTTRDQRHGAGFLKVAPNGPRIKYNNWKVLELDQELYFGKLHFLKLNGQQRVWWRKRMHYDDQVRS
jgi:hypothetical protein